MTEHEPGDLKVDINGPRNIDENGSYIQKYPLLTRYIETRSFETKNENSLIRITPESLIFTFNPLTLEASCENQQFNIQNISSQLVKILLLPVQTKYFSLNYILTNWLAPGLNLVVHVNFHPTIARQYSDWVRVCCYSDNNLMVPIKAIPVHTNTINIPEKINFGCVPIGKMAIFKMTLHPVENMKIKFLFIIIATDISYFKIVPSQGTIEDKPVEIEISYCPIEYITASIPVQLYLPPLTMTPHYFMVEAYTKPFIISEKSTAVSKKIDRKETKHRKQPSLFNKKQLIKSYKDDIARTSKPKEEPKNLTRHELNIFFIRKDVPERDPEEQLGPNGIFMDENEELKSKAMKHFQQIVQDIKEDNKRAILSDKKERIFKIDYSPELEMEIIKENLAFKDEYKSKMNPINEGIHPIYIRQKVIRRYEKNVVSKLLDNTENNLWHIHYQKLWMFIQVARSILINQRMLRRLEILKKITPEKIQELEVKDYE